MSGKPTILFDLDQTIIPWDTQLVFRSYILQKEPLRRFLTLIFLVFLPLAKLLDTGTMKRIFHSYLWRMPHPRLQNHIKNFLEEWLPKITYPEMIELIERHQGDGHHLVLSSASPEIWVAPLGKKLGFQQCLGTRFDWPDHTPLFPELIGENHKGLEKVHRLESVGIREALAGYSDSKADLPMLALCKEKYLINPLSSFHKHGVEQKWPILTPKRPWKNRLHFGFVCALQLFGLWKP